MSPIIIVGERFGERMNRRVGLILGLFIAGARWPRSVLRRVLPARNGRRT